VYVEDPITVHVNRMDGVGSIYYWTTTASGVMQVPFGGTASEYLTASTTGHCVGCHDISSTGLIAFTYDGGDATMGIKRMSDGADVVPVGVQYGNFHTWAPDGSYLISSFQGSLLLYDGATGAFVSEIATGGYSTQPDWSPDGTQVTFVMPTSPSCDWCSSGGRIAVMDYVGNGQFANVRLLYDPGAPYNAYYPTFSPDGEWIAFDLSTGDSYDDADAMLYVMPSAGGAPIELASANLTSGLTNSWPRWAPLPDDDVLWLAFSSKRNYGNVTAGGYPQIWVAGFEPARAEAGEDPTWPAFWLPGQASSESNHIPVWAQ
jgi:Tol biopolymer transport system component